MSTEMPISVTWLIRGNKKHSGRMITNINDNPEDKIKFNPIYTIHESHIVLLDKKQSEKMPLIGTNVIVVIGGKRFKGQILADVGNEKYWNYDIKFKKIMLSEIIGNKLSQEKIRILHRNVI